LAIEVGPITPIRLIQILGLLGVRTGTVVFSGAAVTLAGAAVQLLPVSVPCMSVTVKALRANTGLVYVGGANVSNLIGFQLSPGETVSLDIDDLNKVYFDVAVNLEGVTYIGVV